MTLPPGVALSADRFLPLVSLATLSFYCGSLVTGGALARSWRHLPPGLRARAAGSYHRWGPRPRALQGGLALLAVALQALLAPGPCAVGAWMALASVAGSVAATLPALGIEKCLVTFFLEQAGVERDRDFLALQKRWEAWRGVQLGLAAGGLLLALACAP